MSHHMASHGAARGTLIVAWALIALAGVAVLDGLMLLARAIPLPTDEGWQAHLFQLAMPLALIAMAAATWTIRRAREPVMGRLAPLALAWLTLVGLVAVFLR